jgi:hypothetical protein
MEYKFIENCQALRKKEFVHETMLCLLILNKKEVACNIQLCLQHDLFKTEFSFSF